MPEDRIFSFQLFLPEEQLPCAHKSSPGPCTSCRELANVERRVHDLASALEQALDERRQLKTQCNSNHDPFSKIPTEVACQIFALCCPPKPTLNEFYDDFHWFINAPGEGGQEYPFQITLGSVCRGWRRIIWSDPSFWNFLSLLISQKTSHTCATTVHQWLARSAPLPLTIRISLHLDIFETLNPSLFTPIMQPLVETLNTSIDRWSLVFLHIPNSFIGKLKSPLPPPLKALLIHPLDDNTSVRSFRDKQDAVFRLGSTPSPSHLMISGYHLNNVSISWNKLTHFDGSFFTKDECLTILRQSPRLLKCRMNAFTSVRSTRDLEPPLVHPSLISLQLSDNACILLRRLSCPALRSISWSLAQHPVSGAPTDFIVRSGCALTSVELDGLTGDEDALIEFLVLQPSIEYLSLDQMGQTFITHFAETAYRDDANTDRQFLPNLREFEYTGTRDVPWSSLPAMVPLRPLSPSKTVSRPINRLRFCFDFSAFEDPSENDYTAKDLVSRDTIEQEDLERILDVIDSGVEIIIDDEDETQVIEFWMKHYSIEYAPIEDEEDEDDSNDGHS